MKFLASILDQYLCLSHIPKLWLLKKLVVALPKKKKIVVVVINLLIADVGLLVNLLGEKLFMLLT
jgi:hypothetical protein